jgi:hypothetical protein
MRVQILVCRAELIQNFVLSFLCEDLLGFGIETQSVQIDEKLVVHFGLRQNTVNLSRDKVLDFLIIELVVGEVAQRFQDVEKLVQCFVSLGR